MTQDERLPPVLGQLGRALHAAAHRDIDIEREVAARERQRRWSRRRRGAAFFVVGALASAGAGAGASSLLSEGEGRPLERESAPRREQPAVAGGIVADSTTADPAGGLPWAAKVFTNASGEDCVAVGQLRDGRLGRVRNGIFRALPIDATGTCGDLAREPLLAGQWAAAGGDPRTVVYGIARDRRPVAVTLAGRTTTVEPHGQGVFIVAAVGVWTTYEARTTGPDGSLVRHTFPP